MSEIIWHPENHLWPRASHVARFMGRHGIASIAELRTQSVRNVEWFWDAALRDMGVEWETLYTTVRDGSEGIAWTRWFVGGQVNVTHNCVDRHVRDGHGREVALYCVAESGRPEDAQRVTFNELHRLVSCCAAALRAEGVKRGDSVALYAPMRLTTVVALFATMKIGARFVPIFCGYGEAALRDRLDSCRAKILFASGTLVRRGRSTDTAAIVAEAAAGIRSVLRVVWTDSADWEKFLEKGSSELIGQNEPAETCSTSTEAEEPCLILHTSGTTGRPKGTVHTHAGCLAQMGKELRYAFDARPGEPFFWVTDIGWMMGPWELIGCLLYRAPVVLLDGAPNYPTSDRLWEICEKLGVVTLGVSPTLIRLLKDATDGRGPGGYNLSRLRLLGSTGEVWDEASYRWYFENVGGGRCPVINISGGTEIVGCHLSPTPLDALKPCSLGGAGLGMDVDVFTDDGHPAARGVTGHLVCKQAAPSMTKGFLNDYARYLETYFTRFPGVWYHGDWAMVDEDGQWFLFGRTDDTLKIAGKRVGPAEVEGALTDHPAVSEAAAIGVPDESKGTMLICFVVLNSHLHGALIDGLWSADRESRVENQDLADSDHARGRVTESDLIEHVARHLGKPLAPKHVFVVPALPKTRSGKIVRSAIARAFLGIPVGDLSGIDNPHAFEAISAFGQPQST